MNALEVIGVLGLVYFGCRIALQACKGIYIYFIRAPRRRNAIAKEKGRWALITGATDGIGKSYAYALAKRGFKIILISRDRRKLCDCAQDITEKHQVETKIVVVDFTHEQEIYENIKSAINGLEIGILVNNVGISYSYPALFLDIPDREKVVPAIIKANVIATTKMCELVMPGMVDRKSGVIINISSLSALIPSPYLSFYAATKCFVEKFSEDLRAEYEEKGLVIQTVLPGYVVSKISKIHKPTWMTPGPDIFVASALSRVGVFDHTTGYIAHSLMARAINLLEYIWKPLAVKILRDALKTVGKKAIAKERRLGTVHES